MSWIKKEENIEKQEELGGVSSISTTDAYELKIKEAYLKESSVQGSQSLSFVLNAETENAELVKTYFVLQGKDGKGYWERDGRRYEHFGFVIAKTVFGLVLKKEIYDVPPVDGFYMDWDNDAKKMVETKGRVFSELIGKTVGACVQMNRKIAGADTKEYPEITHFFDVETGLFYTEEDTGKKRKLDKWLDNKKDYKIIEETKKESSFGKKQSTEDGEPKKNKWAR